MNVQSSIFWSLDDKGKITINQSKLTNFLSESGFSKSIMPDGNIIYLKEKGNIVSEVYDSDIIDFVSEHLKKIKKEDVLETFSKGVSTYLSPSKLKLLNTISLLNDRDKKNYSFFHFRNQSCQVGNGKIISTEYEMLKNKIWDRRIIQRDYTPLQRNDTSQFERFCFNISGKNEDRYLALKTIIGYLLHRYQDPKNTKAIILVDEKISFDGEANGGTGKTLLIKAIGKCREIIIMNGKGLKSKSWFKNQRIEHTTDLVFYDDVNKEFSLEELYSEITTGMVVEKKYKGELYIKPEDSPKLVISSNYVVKGTGGNTDARRRCDFEIANHYSGDLTPFDEFGNNFFDDWDSDEWNAFYTFMIKCVLEYFEHGLITAKPINLKMNGLIYSTNLEFFSFLETGIVELNKWECKKTVLALFIEQYPFYKNLSPHKFTKWMKIYAKSEGHVYEDKSSGGKYTFYLKTVKEVKDEK
ncbi:hypothetical protein H9I45_15305 [Polaribacter haliotis]|uniref:Uncharacterized protein n=1 Tax=Polaribacter haliotis TaxID=1888915 RepID=A0A7L8AF95_9FLAO|nr:hypothetical protein [Polaribacter haliotis]QOD60686.1 hypothetical protein H9I45_15305 [Polaribacter haliotis]